MPYLCHILLTSDIIDLQYTFQMQKLFVRAAIEVTGNKKSLKCFPPESVVRAAIEVTCNKKSLKCFPPESVHAWTRMLINFAPFLRSRRGCECCEGHKKC
jgi:hypothetical protein